MEQGLALGLGLDVGRREEEEEEAASGDEEEGGKEDGEVRRSLQPALPLKLLPLLPVPRQPSPPLLRFPSSTATSKNLDNESWVFVSFSSWVPYGLKDLAMELCP